MKNNKSALRLIPLMAAALWASSALAEPGWTHGGDVSLSGWTHGGDISFWEKIKALLASI
jgi:hypothetical protein